MSNVVVCPVSRGFESDCSWNTDLVLQSLFQHFLFLTGEVQQHRYGSYELKSLAERDTQSQTGVPQSAAQLSHWLAAGRRTVLHTLISRTLDSWLTSASLDDINLRTTCLRYSKLISRESLRSEVLVTVVLEVGGLGVDAGGGSGQTLSCFSARLSGSFSFPSTSGSGFSFYRAQIRKHK